MCAILLIFVVYVALVSGDVTGDRQLLDRVEVLERKLSTLTDAYEMLLEDRHVKNDCNCSYLEEDIRDIGIIAAKNRHNILVNSDMIEVNVNSIIDMEEKVESNTGNLEMLNTKVIFSAQVTTGYAVTGDLIFDRVDINIGGAFDGPGGVFRAPISGIYKLTFSAETAQGKLEYANIRVFKNGSDIMLIIIDGNGADDQNNLSYTWMSHLIQGDELTFNSARYLQVSDTGPVTFTGELIHIEN